MVPRRIHGYPVAICYIFLSQHTVWVPGARGSVRKSGIYSVVSMETGDSTVRLELDVPSQDQ